MGLAEAVQIGTLISVAVAAIGLVVGVIIYHRQMNAQLFVEYTKRYEEIMQEFPNGAREARFDLSSTVPQPSRELTLAVLRYLNLCSEEFYLFDKWYLSRSIWKIWEDELLRTLRSPLVRREWQHLREEFVSYPAFLRYVEKAQED